MPPRFPILVISYREESRRALADNLRQRAIPFEVCTTFCEAENLAIAGLYNGILVDLPSIVKAKGEEKIVACSLTGFYPTFRARAIGSVLVPMSMPGDAKQESSLDGFLNKTCLGFYPRKLRLHRRHDICLPTVRIGVEAEERGFTLNISWGGFFVVDMSPEKYSPGDTVVLRLPTFDDLEIVTNIRWIQSWGRQHAPGIGVQFESVDEPLEIALSKFLKLKKDKDRDRVVV
ncbi:MAG TPA: PilZ domain-containing protein [Desulfuromonadaceae bacterium]|jgi:hypothetical protein